MLSKPFAAPRPAVKRKLLPPTLLLKPVTGAACPPSRPAEGSAEPCGSDSYGKPCALGPGSALDTNYAEPEIDSLGGKHQAADSALSSVRARAPASAESPCLSGITAADEHAAGAEPAGKIQTHRKRRRLLVAPTMQTPLQPPVRLPCTSSAQCRPAASTDQHGPSLLPGKATESAARQDLPQPAPSPPAVVLEQQPAAQDARARSAENSKAQNLGRAAIEAKEADQSITSDVKENPALANASASVPNTAAHPSSSTVTKSTAAPENMGSPQKNRSARKLDQALQRPSLLHLVSSSAAAGKDLFPGRKPLRTPATHVRIPLPEAAQAQAPRKSGNSDGGFKAPAKRLTFTMPPPKVPPGKSGSCLPLLAALPKTAPAGSHLQAGRVWPAMLLSAAGANALPQEGPAGLGSPLVVPTSRALLFSGCVCKKAQAAQACPGPPGYAEKASQGFPAKGLGLRPFSIPGIPTPEDGLQKPLFGEDSKTARPVASLSRSAQEAGDTCGINEQELLDLGLLTPPSKNPRDRLLPLEDEASPNYKGWDLAVSLGARSSSGAGIKCAQVGLEGAKGSPLSQPLTERHSESFSPHSGAFQDEGLQSSAAGVGLEEKKKKERKELAGSSSAHTNGSVEIGDVQLTESAQPTPVGGAGLAEDEYCSTQELLVPQLPGNEKAGKAAAMPSITFVLDRLREKPLAAEAATPVLLVSHGLMRSIQQGLLPRMLAIPSTQDRASEAPDGSVSVLSSVLKCLTFAIPDRRMSWQEPMQISQLLPDTQLQGQRHRFEEILSSREMQAAEIMRAIEDRHPGMSRMVKLAFS